MQAVLTRESRRLIKHVWAQVQRLLQPLLRGKAAAETVGQA